MTPEVINITLQFLQRTTLKGEEVDAFTTCVQSLQAEYQRLTRPQPEETNDKPTA